MFGKLCAVCVASLAIAASAAAQTVPANPFFRSVIVTTAAPSGFVNPNGATLAVTSITLVNYNTTEQQIRIAQMTASGGASCNGTMGGAGSPLQVIVPPSSTLQLPFPSGLVFKPLSGATCLQITDATKQTANVTVYINGFTQ